MKLFYEIIQIALGTRTKLNRHVTDTEWKEVFVMSQKQAVAGVLFPVLDEICKMGQKPPMDVLYDWIGLSEQIRNQNQLLNKRCKDITEFWADRGYESCILKGQGNALMYRKPESRTPGDIDIWVFGKRDEITRIVKEKCSNSFEQYHHIYFPVFYDVTVEVHYIPGTLIRPKYNKRFLEWCEDEKDRFIKGGGIKYDSLLGFAMPSAEFNAIFQLTHIYTHFFIEGIGLRHFVDYYYVLRCLDYQKRSGVKEKLRWLGLENFAKGVMWIEQHCLALEDSYLLVEPDEKIGKLVIMEIEEGGNFGQFDSRYSVRNKGILSRGIADTKRLLVLAREFPSDCFWKVMEKVANQRWKLK